MTRHPYCWSAIDCLSVALGVVCGFSIHSTGTILFVIGPLVLVDAELRAGFIGTAYSSENVMIFASWGLI